MVDMQTPVTPATDDAATAELSTQPAVWSGGGGRAALLREIWRKYTSMRTALLLLSLLALAAIPGTFIPQRDLDPVKVDSYLANHPKLGPFLDHLQLFNVFSSVWFFLIYALLFVSLVGCLVPRINKHAKAIRRRPPNAPRNLTRMRISTQWRVDDAPAAYLDGIHKTLRSQRWRADRRDEDNGATTVAAEKGFSRETGNLIFHVSLLILLVGIALSSLFGYKGTVLVNEGGGGFANTHANYDVFTGGALFKNSQLAPFSFTMSQFKAAYDSSSGEPLNFQAFIDYKTNPTATAQPYDVRVNHPLDVDGAKVFLVGHGYSVKIKVTNAKGQVVYDAYTPFLPDNSEFTSHGVVKVPYLGTGKDQLGLTGFFYPTFANTTAGPESIYPAAKYPVLSLAAWSGDLGLSSGVPQSVYSLPVTNLTSMGQTQLRPGKSWHLKDGATVTFGGVNQWATFQVAHEPGKRTLLVGAILVIAGLLASLRVRRRRFWVRAIPAPSGDPDRRTVVTAAGLARSDGDGFADELGELVASIGGPRPEAGQSGTAPSETVEGDNR
jgi:cytochrome c biogenesis protein